MGQLTELTPLPFFHENMPTVQVIGTAEERANFYAWLNARDQALIKNTVSQVLAMQSDPLSKHPEAAAAGYWAGLKMKANGQPYSKRSFLNWSKDTGKERLTNGMWSKEVGRAWLFG